jgi:heme oxygenase (biliverdin-IX-beta and delta-forming)
LLGLAPETVHKSSLLSRLNVATRRWHADVDGPWLDLLRPTAGRADYLAQLVRTYGFIAPFESACRYTPGLPHALDSHPYTRAGLIAHDVLALGLSASQVASIPQCHSITTFGDVPQALGWLYVVERGTLLHEGIRRRIVAHLPDIENACTYLAASAGELGDEWHALGRTLDRIGTRPEVASQVISAAHNAFECVKQWFRNNGAELKRSTG